MTLIVTSMGAVLTSLLGVLVGSALSSRSQCLTTKAVQIDLPLGEPDRHAENGASWLGAWWDLWGA